MAQRSTAKCSTPASGPNTGAPRPAEAVARAKADVAGRGLVATIVQNYYAAGRRAAQSWRARKQSLQRSAAVPRHHAAAGGRRRSGALRRRQGADSGRAAAARRAGRRARRAEEPARPVGARLSRLPRRHSRSSTICRTSRRCRRSTTSRPRRAEQPGRRAAEASVQQETSGVERRARRRAAVGLVRLFLRHQRQPVRHLRPRRATGCSARSVQAQLTIPLWNWGATQSKLRQAQLRVQQAKSGADAGAASAAGEPHARSTARREVARDQVDVAARVARSRHGKPAPDAAALSGGRSLGARSRRRADHADPGAQRLRRWAGAVSRGAGRAADADRNAMNFMRTIHSLRLLRGARRHRSPRAASKEADTEAGRARCRCRRHPRQHPP